jgi:hypothetical protein
MKALLRNPAFAVACLLLALYLGLVRQQRLEQLKDLDHTGVPSSGGTEVGSLTWMQSSLGRLVDSVAYPDLEPIAAVRSIGLDLLDTESARTRAARLELARWTAPGDFPWLTELLEITAVDGQPAYNLHLTAIGDEAQVLSWTEHILNSPTGQGYLCDPGRVHLEATTSGQLKLDLVIRIWPTDAFIPPSDRTEAST